MTGHDDEDSDGSDTDVLPGVDVTPADLEGTVEMDREALIARIQSDRRARSGEKAEGGAEQESDGAKTVRVPSVDEETKPTTTVKLPAVSDETQNYDVPESVMDELRKDRLHTLDIPLEAIEEAREEGTTAVLQDDEILEFTAIIDRNGRIQLPESALKSRYGPGKRVYVVMRVAATDE